MSDRAGGTTGGLPSRLSKSDRRAARVQLSEWMRPAEMSAVFEKYDRQLQDHLFAQSGLEFLMEAYCAAVFARLRGAAKVRLLPSSQKKPDFELCVASQSELFECTEILNPDRLRGDEARTKLQKIPSTTSTHKEPELDLRSIASDLAVSIKKKSAILDYPAGTNLLIYFNRPHHMNNLDDVDYKILTSPTQKINHQFSSIWILAGFGAYRIDPAPLVQIPDPERNPKPDPSFRPTPISEIFETVWPKDETGRKKNAG